MSGSLWDLSVPGEVGWQKVESSQDGFQVEQPEAKTKATLDTLVQPGLSLEDATKLMIMQLMLQGAEEVKFITVFAAGKEASQLLATHGKTAVWSWVWVNGDNVQILMCGSRKVSSNAEALCKGLVNSLKIKLAPTTGK
jgi:hypothetical protein